MEGEEAPAAGGGRRASPGKKGGVVAASRPRFRARAAAGRSEDGSAGLVDLVDGVLAGDTAAWPALWTNLVPIIESVASRPRWTGRLCRSVDDRADIVLRVMEHLAAGEHAALRDFRDPENGRPVSSFVKWMRSVAIRASIDHVREHPDYRGRRGSKDGLHWITHEPLPDEGDAVEASEDDPIALLDAHLLAERLGPGLTPVQRAALGLRLQDLDYDDIAKELGLADGEAAKREFRAAVTWLRLHHVE